MFKSIQTKIILILIIISLIMIVGTGMFYISLLESNKNVGQETEQIETNIQNAKTILVIVSVSFSIIRSSSNILFFKDDNSSNCKTYK